MNQELLNGKRYLLEDLKLNEDPFAVSVLRVTKKSYLVKNDFGKETWIRKTNMTDISRSKFIAKLLNVRYAVIESI